eukprot:jgi/Chlat1/3937/Chrsp26S04031
MAPATAEAAETTGEGGRERRESDWSGAVPPLPPSGVDVVVAGRPPAAPQPAALPLSPKSPANSPRHHHHHHHSRSHNRAHHSTEEHGSRSHSHNHHHSRSPDPHNHGHDRSRSPKAVHGGHHRRLTSGEHRHTQEHDAQRPQHHSPREHGHHRRQASGGEHKPSLEHSVHGRPPQHSLGHRHSPKDSPRHSQDYDRQGQQDAASAQEFVDDVQHKESDDDGTNLRHRLMDAVAVAATSLDMGAETLHDNGYSSRETSGAEQVPFRKHTSKATNSLNGQDAVTKKVGWRWWNGRRGLRGRNSRRLLYLISTNFFYFCCELAYGLISGRIALVSDAFHLCFGCCVLAGSLWAMQLAKLPADDTYSYGYDRMEVLAAFTNTLFLLFLAFSVCVEALHSIIEPESEHKHYLIVSAVSNLLVNLLGVAFFRRYARIRMVYRCSADMNLHAVYLHVFSDSIRSGGVILANWLLTLRVPGAEAIVNVLVAAVILAVVWPLFRASAKLLLQTAPADIPVGVISKCLREVSSHHGVLRVSNFRFWAASPGSVVGTLLVTVKPQTDQQHILRQVHRAFMSNLGVINLTVQIEIKDGSE